MITIKHKVKAEALDFRGYGVVKDLGKVGFIKGLLPGEEAYISISFEKKNFFEGEVIELLTKSKYRKETDNLVDNNSLIHLDNEYQLKFQTDITLESFLRNGIKGFIVNDIITDKKYYHYRNKALFFVENKPFIKLGGYFEKSRKFIELDSLIIADELINEYLVLLKDYYKEERIYYHDLNSIMIRSNTKEVMIVFITKSQKVIPRLLYEPFLKDERVVSIYQNYQSDPTRNLGFTHILNVKDKYIIDNIGNYQFILYPNSFFQVNREVTKLSYDFIQTLLSKDDLVIDAFAGMSSIGQYISSSVNKVYSIEIDEDSIKSAEESMILNKVDNLEIIKGNFNQKFKTVKRVATSVIIDPPRAGLNEEVVKELNLSKVKKIIYVSCNLKTLVRDIKLLDNYKVISVTPVKMFYQTVEMETIVYMERIDEDK